jgi:hypothetical protein
MLQFTHPTRRFLLSLAGLPLLLSCSSAPSLPVVPSVLAPSVIRISAPVDGAIQVWGTAGAVSEPTVTTVTLTVYRPGAYQVLHLNHVGLPIVSSYAVVRPDGSFGPVAVGGSDNPVRAGDEVDVTPQAGLREAGLAETLLVP